jgi:hypothetical protein
MDKHMAEKIDYLANSSGAYLYHHGVPVDYSRAVGKCVHGFHRQICRAHDIMA